MLQRGTTELIIAILGLFFLCTLLVVLFVLFQKKKNTMLLHQKEVQKQFEKEIAESQVEIREQTLRNISWELHDNIGQLLTLAKIQLQSVEDNHSNTKFLNENLTNILSEVRALSRVINPDFIANISLIEAVELEISRFNRLNYIQSSLEIIGQPYRLDDKTEIVIFRILQEFFSNTIKHSRASKLTIYMNYNLNSINIIAQDNGKGFDTNLVNNNGIGLSNMKKRGKLVQCDISIQSQPNQGTKLIIHYNSKKND